MDGKFAKGHNMISTIYKLKINGNPTNITVLSAHSWFSRLKGLLGTLSLDKHTCLWIKPCHSIHTVGMIYAIDVLFLDRNNYVKKISQNVKPFRFRWASKHAISVIELASGSVKFLGIKNGDSLVFESE